MLEQLLQKTFLGNRVLDYCLATLFFLGALLFIRITHHLVLRRARVWAARTKTSLDDFLLTVLQKSFLPLLYFGAFYLATQSLSLHTTLQKSLSVLGAALLTIVLIRGVVAVLRFLLLEHWLSKQKDRANLEGRIRGLMPILNIVVWGVGAVFFLDNLGFKITTVVAGLGIGGVAVALGAQAVLGDLFSYFAILFDRPFVIGDFIIVGDCLGTVEQIGIKTTRVRSLGGEILVFCNTDLTNSRVRNYKKMAERRVVFKLGLTYQTTLSQLREAPSLIREIVEKAPHTRFDRAHFSAYGDYALIFEIVYYVTKPDYAVYMDAQQIINLAIREEFDKLGIEFAYPTQTLLLTREDETPARRSTNK